MRRRYTNMNRALKYAAVALCGLGLGAAGTDADGQGGAATTLQKEKRQWETHQWQKHGRLRISQSGHFFEFEDGTGFFWLGDTAWLLGRLTPEDVDRYMRNRAALGFNVI